MFGVSIDVSATSIIPNTQRLNSRTSTVVNSKRFVVLPVVGLIITEFSVTIAYSAKAFTFKTFSDLEKIKSLSLAMNVSAALTDVTIAAILCTILQCSKTGYAKSNRLINKLMAFTINTGLLTSTCACISLITFLALPGSFVYICFFLLMGHLYCNSLLASLNPRERLRDGLAMSLNEIPIRHMHDVPTRPVHMNLELSAVLPSPAFAASETGLNSHDTPKRISIPELQTV
ncbi:hypothetical protein C8T65DRAFT_739767 [Cerioporus squamosus]|nr:hypothetical protein C8T65DRAFT_739767 [Cerioporus squamosus]